MSKSLELGRGNPAVLYVTLSLVVPPGVFPDKVPVGPALAGCLVEFTA